MNNSLVIRSHPATQLIVCPSPEHCRSAYEFDCLERKQSQTVAWCYDCGSQEARNFVQGLSLVEDTPEVFLISNICLE